MKKKPIYTLKMAKYLTNRGFEVIGTAPNKMNLKKICWFFEDTPELEAAYNEYVAAGKQGNKVANTDYIPKAPNELIARMHLQQGMPIEAIATITHKTIEEVKAAIDAEVDLHRLFAIAAMSDAERQQLMEAKTEDERNQLIMARMRRGGYTAYGAHKVYEYPADDTAEGVREDD